MVKLVSSQITQNTLEHNEQLQEEIKQESEKWREYVDLQEISLDNLGIWIIANIIKKVRDENIDWFIGFVGTEGVGKTTLALNIFGTICKFAQIDVANQLRETLVYDDSEFLKKLSKLDMDKKYRPWLLDEGANILLNRESTSKERIYIVKFFNVMRFLNNIVLICTPNIEMLDKIVREHRLKSIFFIEKRGIYNYYDKDQINRMINIFKKNRRWTWVEPRFAGAYDVNPQLQEITNKIKVEYVMNFKEDILKYLRKKDK